MVLNTLIRRGAAWLACSAMLFAALAPAMSHATAARGSDVWTEICSAAGIKMVQTADGQGDPADPAPVEHCDFCATHPTHVALMPGKASSMPLLLGRDCYPALFFQSPRPLAAWIHAQSRAPPR